MDAPYDHKQLILFAIMILGSWVEGLHPNHHFLLACWVGAITRANLHHGYFSQGIIPKKWAAKINLQDDWIISLTAASFNLDFFSVWGIDFLHFDKMDSQDGLDKLDSQMAWTPQTPFRQVLMTAAKNPPLLLGGRVGGRLCGQGGGLICLKGCFTT